MRFLFYKLSKLFKRKNKMRKALLVGIDEYPVKKLDGCILDVDRMEQVLARNGDGSDNFHVDVMRNELSSKKIMKAIADLFAQQNEVSLFYFSGHGRPTLSGSEIVIPSDIAAERYLWGIPLSAIMELVNKSPAKYKVVILDSCYAGSMGKINMASDFSELRDGVTIMTACRENETSSIKPGEGSFFTSILSSAMKGAAANLLGQITLNSLYTYADSFFGPGEQRPMFKANTAVSVVIRTVIPKVPTSVICRTLNLFPADDAQYALDPSYEFTNTPDSIHLHHEPWATPDHVAILKNLQKLESIGLVVPSEKEHMYEAAMQSSSCRLTSEGRFYWRLVNKGLIS